MRALDFGVPSLSSPFNSSAPLLCERSATSVAWTTFPWSPFSLPVYLLLSHCCCLRTHTNEMYLSRTQGVSIKKLLNIERRGVQLPPQRFVSRHVVVVRGEPLFGAQPMCYLPPLPFLPFSSQPYLSPTKSAQAPLYPRTLGKGQHSLQRASACTFRRRRYLLNVVSGCKPHPPAASCLESQEEAHASPMLCWWLALLDNTGEQKERPIPYTVHGCCS